MKDNDRLLTEEAADEVVHGIDNVWYASYKSEFALLTNVNGYLQRYQYADEEDLESAMRAVRRYAVKRKSDKQNPPTRKVSTGHDVIDAFFEAEGKVFRDE